MTSTADLSDSGSVYRTIARVTFDDLRACLYRLRHLLAEVGPDGAPALTELTVRRVRHVRDFVDALGTSGGGDTPLLPLEAYAACVRDLDDLPTTDPVTTCEHVIELVERLGRQVECLAHV